MRDGTWTILTALHHNTGQNKQIKARADFNISFLLILTRWGQIEKYESYTFQVASMTCANTRRYLGKEQKKKKTLKEKKQIRKKKDIKMQRKWISAFKPRCWFFMQYLLIPSFI